MSLRLRTPRSIVWLALCAFLSSTGLPLYESHGIGAADDAACLSAGSQQASTAAMSALELDGQPTHCAVCHLLRAVNGTITPSVVSLAIPAPLPASTLRILDTTTAADHSVRACRAPPLNS
ncbi:MAG: hypothetical protein ACRD2N_07325 [Vicinamibacterales bacterium]